MRIFMTLMIHHWLKPQWKNQREAVYKNDSDDYQPYIGNDDDNSNHKPKM